VDSELSGTRILITGASGGIGQATARAFADEGSALALHCHRNRSAATALADALDTDTVVVQGDLCEEDATDLVFQRAIDALGGLDVLVVNAGIWESTATPVYAMSLLQWRATIDADLTSAFLSCRAFLRHVAECRPQSAAIVLVGSTAALFGEAGHADYAAAKAGMIHGLLPSLKNEIVQLAPRGRVNGVCPGWTDTPMAAAGLASLSEVDRVLSTMSLRKIARPENVAQTIVWLSSDRLAGHISGAIVPVAGGMEGRLLWLGDAGVSLSNQIAR